jgi:hypothetical protein
MAVRARWTWSSENEASRILRDETRDGNSSATNVETISQNIAAEKYFIVGAREFSVGTPT